MKRIANLARAFLGAALTVAIPPSYAWAQVDHRLESPQGGNAEQRESARKSAKPAEKKLKQLPKELFPPTAGSGSEQPPSVVLGSPGENNPNSGGNRPPNQ